MADNDPISDATPRKRQKRTESGAYYSSNDSGDELSHDDFNTVATVPIKSQKRRLLGSADQHRGGNTTREIYTEQSQESQRHVTQKTQTLAGSSIFQSALTQPTQPLIPRTSPPPSSDVLVGRSSPSQPVISPPRKPLPPPIRRAPFAKPSLLASAMAPPGTAFRRPFGIPQSATRVSSDEEDNDPPIQYSSSDEETQSALKPTNFKPGGRQLDSAPHASTVIRESPRAPVSSPPHRSSSAQRQSGDGMSTFNRIMAGFMYNEKPNGVVYRSLDDIYDYGLREKVNHLQKVLPHESVQRCMDALTKRKGNVEDSATWLTENTQEIGSVENDADELASTSPVPKRGVAISKAYPQSSAPLRPFKAPVKSIAEKYRSKQLAPKPSQDQATEPEDEDEDLDVTKPRRRLVQGRNGGRPIPSPVLSPPSHGQSQLTQKKPQQIVISDEEDAASSGVGEDDDGDDVVEVEIETQHDRSLLQFFNECSVRDVVDLCNQPEASVKIVLDKRPFKNLDEIRSITASSETKSGKRSKARPIGDKIVDVCSEVRRGFEAVGELVDECGAIARPIQNTLRNWGVGANEEGELHLMNLENSHDSGIGTPASSLSPGQTPAPHNKSKGTFLAQPKSMSPDVTLKEYQLVGLNWLNLLWSKKISCILADDMGLGKTCQIITFLAHLQEQKVDGVHLVIVPGSTLENWLREFARFAPNLNVQPYYGSQAERAELRASIEEEFSSIDVVITTYDIAVKKEDHHFLRRQVDPLVTVYDEAHQLRNTQTDRYRQLIRIPATFRVLLTGTPLQNNLQELVAILAFIMPKLFNDKKSELEYIFKHKASTKDADHAALLSSQRIARARSMITPFILRRKKDQVLDLPAKHCRVEYCDMTPTQANYYADLIDEARLVYADRLEGKTKAKATSGAKASATTMMTLREAAIHPLLCLRIYDDRKLDKIAKELLKREWADNSMERVMAYLKGEHHQSFKGGDFGMHKFCAERDYLSKFMLKPNAWMDAGKVDVFKKLVGGFSSNGDRTLVFSQFTTLLDILEAVLGSLGISFVRLDGSTDMNERQDLIDTFTNDTSIGVFLLSTRAGGAGLNLAAANKVIIFDAGFNPQDDVQAENRAHRVGQTREVEVIRLVTRGTIEEQVLALGESKLALDERVSNGAESGGNGSGAETDAEKTGQKKVEEMFLRKLQESGPARVDVPSADTSDKETVDDVDEQKTKPARKTGSKGAKPTRGNMDLRDAFKAGLSKAGVNVRSKQAQF